MSDPNPVINETHDGAPVDPNTIMAERRAKLARLREQGVAYPNDCQPAHRAHDLATHHGFKTREQLQADRANATYIGEQLSAASVSVPAAAPPPSPICAVMS